MTLLELMQIANTYYPDSGLDQYFDGRTGEAIRPFAPGDSLAWSICIELEETFEENALEEQQLNEAVRVMSAYLNEVGLVLKGLKEHACH